MANGEFGYCEDCKFWDASAEGQVKPCSRINNRNQVDVELPEGQTPADQQRFKTRAKYGCPLFEPVEGMEGNTNRGQTETGPTPEEENAEPSPENLDDFLNY